MSLQWQQINENGWQADEWRIGRNTIVGEHHYSLYRDFERRGVFTSLPAAMERADEIERRLSAAISGGECDGVR